MERVWRRKTPAFVRSLLMDISLKEDEPSGGIEPEQMSKDGISLPMMVPCGADLTPAAEEENISSSSSSSLRPCGLCLSNPARYTCPRCNVPYCALSCYRGSAHMACSEQFYKDCVSQELRQHGRAEHEDRIHMRDVLLRMRRVEGGMDRVTRELMENSGGRVTERDTEMLALLSRLAEIQTDREEGHEDEVQEILQRLMQTDGEEEEGKEEEDVVTKLSGLNIECLSEDALWTLLPEKDKKKFKQLLKDGGISALVPIWRPWWEEHERDRAVLIEELQQEAYAEATSSLEGEDRDLQDLDAASEPPSPLKQEVKKHKIKMEGSRNAPPPISCKIPPLSSLCSASPSPLVKFSLVNVLYGYAFTLRLFNGDVSETRQLLEFTQLLLSVSECLGRSRTFGSFSEALSAAMAAVSAEHYDSDSALSAVEGVAHILSGASKDEEAGYTLSALAQLRSVFSRARTAAPRDHAHFRRMCFLAGKKCEFLQAWANENTHTLQGLARWAWSECQRQKGERQEMERERKRVEESWTKEKARGKVMIEEI